MPLTKNDQMILEDAVLTCLSDYKEHVHYYYCPANTSIFSKFLFVLHQIDFDLVFYSLNIENQLWEWS
jgi:hypothetical protein